MSIVLPEPGGEVISGFEVFSSTVDAFYRAEMDRDWPRMWSYFTEYAQSELPLPSFTEQMSGSDKLIELQILAIQNHGADRDIPDVITAQVEVTFQRTVQESPKFYGIDEGTDVWLQANGRWYWVVRY